jgi:DNA (cytosine-5)-methyltransferase 1
MARDYKGFGNQDMKDGRGLIVYENHPTDSRVREMGTVCTTVTARWGTGGGNVPFALAENTIGRQPMNGGNGNGFTEGGPMYTLNATGVHGVAYGFEPGIAKREGNPNRFVEDKTPTLRAHMGDNQIAMASRMAVRRLTPVECERLQGFPDNHTNIPWRKKDESPDGPRYKAMGNSMAVPVMHWIGQQIQQVEVL